MKQDEAHIIQEILDGKTDRFEYFLNQYGQQVFRLVVRIVSSPEDAEELTQDIFLKAFQHMSSFQAESRFSTWIYRIAYNTAISEMRKKKESAIGWDDAMLARLSDEEVDDALDDDSEEQITRMNEALNRLEAHERAMITLFYMEDKSLAEIAFILGLKENHVKVKLHRIRKKLYVLMKEES